MPTVEDLLWKIDASTEGLRRELKRGEQSGDQFHRKMDRSVAGVERSFTGLGAVLTRTVGPALAGLGVGALATEIYQVNRQFQDLKTGLEVAAGSAAAADVEFARLRVFAKDTPYQLSEVVTSYIRLKNLGLDPTNKALKSYGDLAASIPNKTLIDFIEAVADATVGEWERLKEFGIKARVEGDKVGFTFKGVRHEVKKNAADIEKFLQELAETNFGGAMEKRMNNISGASSNLKDNLDELFVTIGQMGADQAIVSVLKGMSGAVSDLADNMDTVVRVGGAAGAAVGGFAVAKISTAAMAAFRVEIASAAAGLAMMNQFGTAATARMVTMAAATATASAAVRGFNITISALGGPVGAALTVVAGGAYLLATNQSLAEAAASKHADALSGFNQVIDLSKGKVRQMTDEVRALNRAQLEAAAEAAKESMHEQARLAMANENPIKMSARLHATGLPSNEVIEILRPVLELQRAVQAGKIGFSELYVEVTKLADADERLKPLAASMVSWAKPMIDAKSNLDEINAALAMLDGRATDTQKKLLGWTAPSGGDGGDGDAKGAKDRAKKIERIEKTLQDKLFGLRFQGAERIREEYKRLIADLDALAQGGGLDEERIQRAKDLAQEIKDMRLDEWDRNQAKAIRESTQELTHKNEQMDRMLEAYGQGGAAVQTLTGQLELENEAMRLGIDLASEQGKEWSLLYRRSQELEGGIDDIADAQQKSAGYAREFGSAYVGEMEAVIWNSKNAEEAVRNLGQAILQIAMRKAILEPAGAAFGSMLTSMVGFADGGVMTGQGQMSLRKYASGGIANSPQLAMFGEGSRPEAYVPLPDGRSIPVTMNGSGGGGIILNVNINNQGGGSANAEMSGRGNGEFDLNVVVEQMEGQMSRNISKGEGLAPAMERRFALQPGVGSFT